MTVTEFIGEKVVYDPDSQVIFGQRGDELQMIAQFNLDVRGWGAIRNLFDTAKGAADFQDELGRFIANAINAAMAKVPDDEEIRFVAVDETHKHDWNDIRYQSVYQDGFQDGAKWLRSNQSMKIQK